MPALRRSSAARRPAVAPIGPGPAAVIGLLVIGLLVFGCGTTDPAAGPASTGGAPTSPADATATTAAAPGGRPSAGCASATTATTGVAASGPRTIDVGGVERTYQLATPAGGPADQPRPLVLEFHGFDSSGPKFAATTHLDDKGTAAGFIVVSPDGTDHTWQLNPHGPDAAFVDALIAEIERAHCVDLDRVFTTGFSAGAAFVIAYSCARQDAIAAIATVAVDFQLGCTRPESILAFHGTKDPLVPYEDGAIGLSLPGTKVRGSELNLSDWATLGGCDPTPQTEVLGTEVTRETWSGCPGRTEVVFYRIEGGSHAWPGADPKLAIGLTTQQVDASDEILAFFGRHRLAVT